MMKRKNNKINFIQCRVESSSKYIYENLFINFSIFCTLFKYYNYMNVNLFIKLNGTVKVTKSLHRFLLF